MAKLLSTAPSPASAQIHRLWRATSQLNVRLGWLSGRSVARVWHLAE
jgi:hypothetical protein